MQYRSYTYRLAPTPEQADRMARSVGCARYVYNAALEQRQRAWQEHRTNIFYRDQNRQLTEAKKDPDLSFLREVHSDVLQYALRDVESAFEGFFAGRSGYPRFKQRTESGSFRLAQRVLPITPKRPKEYVSIQVRQDERRWGAVKLPKLGWVKARLHRPLRGTIKTATITCTPNGWQVSLLVEQEHPVPVAVSPPQAPVGVDAGVVQSYTTSTGARLQVPQPSPGRQRRRRRLEQKLARQELGSAGRERTRRQLARLRYRERLARTDALHKISAQLVAQHDLIAIENLRVRHMTRSARGTLEAPGSGVAQKAGLNRAILAQGWGTFRSMLQYKADAAGVPVVLVAPRNTSQTCHACGTVDPRSRESQAVFVCRSCGHAENADMNAAQNILAAGLAVAAGGALSAMAPKPEGVDSGLHGAPRVRSS